MLPSQLWVPPSSSANNTCFALLRGICLCKAEQLKGKEKCLSSKIARHRYAALHFCHPWGLGSVIFHPWNNGQVPRFNMKMNLCIPMKMIPNGSEEHRSVLFGHCMWREMWASWGGSNGEQQRQSDLVKLLYEERWKELEMFSLEKCDSRTQGSSLFDIYSSSTKEGIKCFLQVLQTGLGVRSQNYNKDELS